ncbi:MAG: ATP-binding protein [Pseudomonadota bacterium]
MIQRLEAWLDQRLARKLMAATAASVTLVSLGFLGPFVGYYRDRLISERAKTSVEVNGLLQGALENAMLKRDLEGLKDIVEHLGAKPSIRGVMILSPKGEVRFASDARQVGKRYDLAAGALCPGCGRILPGLAATAFLDNGTNGNILRSVNPVSNQPRCKECHGSATDNPVNGILVVDYDADEIRRDAFDMALALSGSGLVVLMSAIGVLGLVVRRSVLAPVGVLKEASQALSAGDLSARVDVTGHDELAHLASSFNDMSSRLESQRRALEMRERFLQALIDAIPDGIRVIAPDYKVLQANRAFAEQQGLALDQIVGQPCHVSSHRLDEPCAPTMVTCPVHEIRRGSGSLTCRHVHKQVDGGELAVEVSAAPLAAVGGAVRSSEPLVVEAIRDLGRDLKHSQEQRLSEIGQLAAGVAHEVRNPLSSIQLALQAVRRGLAQDGSSLAGDNLDLMDHEIDRCIRVTDRLLRLASPPSELAELVALEDIVPEVVSLLRAEGDGLGVGVDLVLADGLRVVATDSEMRMLVFNLAQNAFHAMPSGGRLEIKGGISGSSVVLTFADTGVGIAAEDLKRIFQPFWSRRGDGSQGTGLGLPICREIVKRHGGSIGVSSELGRGTVFEVVLPWAEASDTQA